MSIEKPMSNVFDAIVIGSGISGGWAAMELCKQGLRTILLERGRQVVHIKDYPTANLHPWEFKYRNNFTQKDLKQQPIQLEDCDYDNKHFFVNDLTHPYIQEKPFNWIRGYQVGGRSLTWGRQCYRWSDLDFEANLKEGVAVDWPIRYKDIAPWYDYVERFIGVSGQKEGLPYLPDGDFLPPMELNCIEQYLAETIKKKDNRFLTIARIANLTRGWKDRGPCLSRNLCSRGCPFGGYFSSNSATIPVAMATNKLTLMPYSLVYEIVYDDAHQRATGVRVIDMLTKEHQEFFAKIIFVNASTIASTALLLNSCSNRFPNGLGNDSGQLGHNLMDHHSSAGAMGIYQGYANQYYKGRRPCGFLIPRYRNLTADEQWDFKRGYNIQGMGSRLSWQDKPYNEMGFGKDFKTKLTTPGPWQIWMAGFGECLPYYDNQIGLDKNKLDQWGQPLIRINFEFKTNEERMMEDIEQSAKNMLSDAGFQEITSFNYHRPGGATIHEMGTARMGTDEKNSVLNGFNQMHAVKNVFVTDGSCMTSSACQNPSLTYMALTARACAYAVQCLKDKRL
ncbi:GMC family oxidoreductase [Olivibacter ginsenosidimutans]|uniref:GMC family oxidoreductase n=1 Tax=Olivibacter ginsenosidimutans TaxID=1176537 RepID=A0ABP9ADN1_9SPHI